MSSELREIWTDAGGRAPAHWSFVRFEDLLAGPKSIAVGVMYPGSHDESGVPLIKVSDVKNGAVVAEPDFRISELVNHEYRRTSLCGNELLITLVGNPGDCAIVDNSMAGWNAARALAVVRLKDPTIRPWLRYVLLSSTAKHLIDARLNTTVQKTLNLKDIRSLPIPIAPQAERNAIVETAAALENKINVNHQINQTLEQMAQAIFKSWFVDFEPVKAKIAALEAGGSEEDALIAAMRAIAGKDEAELTRLQAERPEQYAELRATVELFPSAMQDSELGEIPEGWGVSDFGAVSKCFDKHRIPLSKRQREQRQGRIPYYGATSVMDYVDEPIFDGVYLLLGEDGSVLREDGSPFTQYIWGKSWVNNHAHVLQGANGVSTEQLYLFIGMQNITAYVTGAVQLKLNQKNMNSIPFIKAPDELNTRFSTHIAPMFDLRRELTEENDSLTRIRDVLLPRLLSGELSVSDVADHLAEEAEPANV